MFRLSVLLPLFFALSCQKPQEASVSKQPDPMVQETVEFQGDVEHIFFHPLIIHKKDSFFNRANRHYNYIQLWFVTLGEFQRVLESLYQRNYILVDIYDTYKSDGKGIHKQSLRLPKGKKPFVMSVDDLNYYKAHIKNGTVSRLVLDKGVIASEEIQPDGTTQIGHNNIVSQLEKFIALHPDFSWKGARAMIALTGFDGVLGYRTQKKGIADEEKALAQPIIDKLKSMKYRFASHSYVHIFSQKVSYATFKRDTDLWEERIASLVGKTDLYIWAYGEDTYNNDKFAYLYQKGFRFFMGVGNVTVPQIRHYRKQPYFFSYRIPIDGKYMTGVFWGSKKSPFFDITKVRDKDRPARI